MAVEVTRFHNLFHARERIAVGHSHSAHETRPIPIQEIHGNGRWPSSAFLSRFGPTMKDAVPTNLHLKCCPARPPAYAAYLFLQTKPSAFASCTAFTKARLAFNVMAVSQTRRGGWAPRKSRANVRSGFRRVGRGGRCRSRSGERRVGEEGRSRWSAYH